MESRLTKKPKILCLHGFRTSGAILEKETQVWPEVVLGKMDLVFIDAPFPAQGKSGVEGKYDPPYFEWFQANEDFKVYWNFNKCIEYIEDCMIKYGPFDGLLGFSQGAMLTAALPGMQAQGEALTKSEKIKFVIIIAGGKLGGSHFSAPKLAENAFSSEIECPSLHFLGKLGYRMSL
ncbi:hypothetical protein RJ639_001000 [Escallonia herrerae]|uniref:Serine hydrolase domain-containing protein n=1 Tax=Escallonia herrerae TaxID=1293975 RepID=A0AA88XAW8_9ASTE|nr:hypothetical protein RJ639_001000 [Escallonia herrerae]